MQQTKSYWSMVVVAGVVAAVAGSACVVTTSTDVSAGGDGGTSATTGGTSSGGTTTTITGGTAGSSGSSSIAGTAGTTTAGGTDGSGTLGCDMGEAGAMTGTKAANCNATAGDKCGTCLQAKCCSELEICNGTNPKNQCGFGGPDGTGELACIETCMKKAFLDNGKVELPDDLGTCANGCGTDACGSVLGTSTSILVGCMHADGDAGCSVECFE